MERNIATEALREDTALSSRWACEDRYRTSLIKGLWRLAQELGILDASDPLSGMGEDFREASEELLALMTDLSGLARSLPMPVTGEELRIKAVVAVQLGLIQNPRLGALSLEDVLEVMQDAVA